MYGLVTHFMFGGPVSWQLVPGPYEYRETEGVFLNFPFSSKVSRRRAFEFIAEQLTTNRITWLSRSGGLWRLDLDGLRNFVGNSWQDAVDWMTGVLLLEPEVETDWVRGLREPREETSVQFIITREEIALSGNQRIFLSHKRVDKPLVRRIGSVLRLLGFEPWIDESDMPAGAELERALLAGMKSSCAAVFFVTVNYEDHNFLATEINYAIAEKRAKGKRFAIITLTVASDNGREIQVPDLLKTYVWKNTKTELEMLQEIIKALPLAVGDVRWRDMST
jgi:hypothetical protein